MLCFFAMGFVDLVGIASNYVKADLNLSDSMANTLPSLVFLWFLIFSIPTSLLMNKIGRKNTVLVSLVMTLTSLLIPVFTLDFAMLLLSFSLLGIGNAIMQTSLNPLVDSVMKGGASASPYYILVPIRNLLDYNTISCWNWRRRVNIRYYQRKIWRNVWLLYYYWLMHHYWWRHCRNFIYWSCY